MNFQYTRWLVHIPFKQYNTLITENITINTFIVREFVLINPLESVKKSVCIILATKKIKNTKLNMK